MNKTKLQGVCHKRLWPLPEYTCTREGPDHDPSFWASVAVNGFFFHAAGVSKSAKEAQDKAAQAALEHISAADPPGPATPPPTTRPSSSSSSTPEGQVAYKNQLNVLAQQKFRSVPVYNSIHKGPPHSPLFKATVTLNGQFFESPQFCRTLREAEHAAARIALMALTPEENQQANSVSVMTGAHVNYKNLLQELAQKGGLKLPTYRTVRDDAAYGPRFSSTVEIEGETFEGENSGTKKQAEANAAKVAWCHLEECRDSRIAAFTSTVILGSAPTSPLSGQSFSAITVNLQQHIANSVQDLKVEINKEHTDRTDESHNDRSTAKKGGSKEYTSPENGSAPPLMACSSDPIGAPSLLCNRVMVYPRRPDLVLPENCIVLPFSDDKWVSVQLGIHQ